MWKTFLTAAIVACVPMLPSLQAQESPELPIDDERFIVSFEEALFTVGSDIQALLDSIASKPEREGNSGSIRYRWEGLAIRTDSEGQVVREITVSAPGIETLAGVSVGDSFEQLISAQGEPDYFSSDEHFYFGPAVSYDGEYVLMVRLHDNIITHLTIVIAV